MKGKIKERASQQNIRLTLTILKFSIFVLIIVGIPLYLFFFHWDWIQQFQSVEEVGAFFSQYKTLSVFLYIGTQILQIIISVIPGQGLQFAAGAFYGFWLGYFFSIIGAVLGTVGAYYLAKLLGRDAIHLFFGEEKIQRFIHRINSKRGVLIIFLIYLVPGAPKDLCNYAAGLSEMKLKPFLIISLVGRSPGMMMSLLIGKKLIDGGYTVAIIVASVALVLFIVGLIFRKKIMGISDRAYEKLHLEEETGDESPETKKS